MAKMGTMGKVPSLGGKPAQQAMKNSVGGMSMPIRSPGKPANLSGKPASVPANKKTKQPKGKAVPSLKPGNIKGIKRGSVANLKGKPVGASA